MARKVRDPRSHAEGEEVMICPSVEIGFICKCGFRVTGCRASNERAKEAVKKACGVVCAIHDIKGVKECAN